MPRFTSFPLPQPSVTDGYFVLLCHILLSQSSKLHGLTLRVEGVLSL